MLDDLNEIDLLLGYAERLAELLDNCHPDDARWQRDVADLRAKLAPSD